MHLICRQWLGRLADLVYPPVCVNCGELVDEASQLRSLCRRCSLDVSRVREPACVCCGHPFYGPDERDYFCEHCTALRPAFRQGRTLVLFKGPARRLLHELKYHRGLHVLHDIECLAREAHELASWARGGILVPVPMHPFKRRERGYNQTELIAEALLRAGVGERVESLLCRTQHGKSQTSFDRMARLANLKNAFAPAPGVSITADHRYILLDDVFTTGSTLNRCSTALRQAGAGTVDVITFGHG